MSQQENLVLSEDHDHVRILRLNRPERKNALTTALGWAIVEAVETAERDDDVWIIGLTGAGDAFCSGLDLSASRDGERTTPLSPQNDQLDDLGWVSQFPLLFRTRCSKLIVGGLNGVAVGAGFSLAMSTDVRLASSRARFLAGYARAGTSPDGGLSWTLPQAIGYERALRFLLEQEMVPAARALELGIVGEVVEEDGFDERFLGYCQQLSALSPIAARQTKNMVSAGLAHADLESHLRIEIANARRGLQTEDSKEAIRAIMEKRTPVFQGR
ncbi:MAG: hypothetical protein GY946_16545 [bacterium]|nr:hypothetical protein [bacterium]